MSSFFMGTVKCFGNTSVREFFFLRCYGIKYYDASWTFIQQAASGPGLVFIAFTDAINQMPGATFWSIMFFLMLLTLGLDSLFGALESVTTALQDVRGFGKLRREILSGEHRMRPDSFFIETMWTHKMPHIPSQDILKNWNRGANPFYPDWLAWNN